MPFTPYRPTSPDKLPSGFKPYQPSQANIGDTSKSDSSQGTMSFLGNVGKAIGGFGVNLAKGIAKPIATAAVTGLAPVEATGRMLMGDQEGANKRLTEGYDVPGLGQIKPVGADIGKEGGIKHELGRMLGTGAEIASTLAGGEGAAGLAEVGAKGALKEAAIQGAKEGAAVGAAGGFGSSVQDENATTGSVIGGTLEGGVLGGVMGGVAGAASPSLSKAGREARIAQKAEKESQKMAEYVMPKLTASEAESIAEREAKGGVGTTKKGLIFKKETPTPSPEHIEMAKEVQGIVDPKKTISSNLNVLGRDIRDVAETKLRPFLEEQKGSWNKRTLQGQLNKIKTDIPAGFVGDQEKIYQRVIDTYMKNIEKAEGRKWVDLWDTRKDIDQIIKKEFGEDILSGEPRKARDTAVRKAREALNGYIEDNTPEGVYKSYMRSLHNKYKVLSNLEEKRTAEILSKAKKSGYEQFKVAHPVATGIGKTIGAGILGEEAIRQGKNALAGSK